MWTYNVNVFLFYIAYVVTGPITKHVGERRVALVCSTVASFSYILLAFSTSAVALFFLFGIVFGLSSGMTHSVSFVILPQYFEKHRGLVICLNVATVGFSLVANPQIIRALQVAFGASGAILVHAGLILNTVVTSALFQPVKRHQRVCEATEDVPKNTIVPEDMKNLPRFETIDEKENTQINEENPDKSLNVKHIAKEVNRCFESCKLFGVLINGFAFAVFLVGFSNFAVLVPLMMKSSGYNATNAALAVSCGSLLNFLGRLSMAPLADRPWFSNKHAYMSGSVIAAIGSLGSSMRILLKKLRNNSKHFCVCVIVNSLDISPFLLWDLRLLLVSLVVWGTGVGVSMGLWMVLVIETVGIEGYIPAIGACGLIAALVTVTLGPLTGVVRDLSSSYMLSVMLCSALQLTAAVMWLFMPCATRRDLRVKDKLQLPDAARS
ncbi:monocarboxylate transporter 14 [Hyalella azteca]|uniref:Monocarboxylate transporter 14 n=1 Tax=Hyalella azteca TaxID=294128 RepID=A0A979FGW4_HYAAZ|nr:monocarboxylate transporter 14 [Hyalella azteca]